MTVVNPGGGGGAVASPVNLVTAAASIALANKLAGGDANNDFQITGDGKLQWGAGAASALDLNLYRASAGLLRTDNDLRVGNLLAAALRSAGGGNVLVQSDAQLLLQASGANTIVTATSAVWQFGTTVQNSVAGNETTTATAGANGAPPAQVAGYLTIKDSAGTSRKLPYYSV